LLDQNYLSLAEVQVMGVDPLHFAEVDYSSTQNDFGGFYNAPNYVNDQTFAILKAAIGEFTISVAIYCIASNSEDSM
jgi:hypothetical protein